MFNALSFNSSRSKQLPKCSLWCHGKYSQFFNSWPTPLLHFSPESAKGPSYSTRLPPFVQQSYDPSSVHSTASDSSVGQPFVVMVLNARISRCQGCRGKIEQGQSSPGDLVLQHKEHVLGRIRELEVGRCQRT